MGAAVTVFNHSALAVARSVMTSRMLAIAAASFLVALFAAAPRSIAASAKHGVSRADIRSLALAIEDEIYDRGYEGDYFPVGGYPLVSGPELSRLGGSCCVMQWMVPRPRTRSRQ